MHLGKIFGIIDKRFLMEDFFPDAYKSVTGATKEEGEDEANFSVWVSKNTLLCRHLFLEADVLN